MLTKAYSEVAMQNNSLKRELTPESIQKMREEMDRAWADFFERTPHENEDIIREWIEERLRWSSANSSTGRLIRNSENID